MKKRVQKYRGKADKYEYETDTDARYIIDFLCTDSSDYSYNTDNVSPDNRKEIENLYLNNITEKIIQKLNNKPINEISEIISNIIDKYIIFDRKFIFERMEKKQNETFAFSNLTKEINYQINIFFIILYNYLLDCFLEINNNFDV